MNQLDGLSNSPLLSAIKICSYFCIVSPSTLDKQSFERLKFEFAIYTKKITEARFIFGFL